MGEGRAIITAVALAMASAAGAAAADCVPQPVIDMHLHFYAGEDDFWGPAPNPFTRQLGPATLAEHVAATATEMERNQVVLAIASARLAWRNHDPARLWHGFELQQPGELDLAALTAAVEEGRVRAIGEVGAQYQGLSPADPRWEPLWELAVEHDLPVAIHTGVGPRGTALGSRPKFRFEYGNPFLLQDVLVRHPRMKVWMMHAGLDLYQRETLAMMHMYPHLYVDIGVATWVRPFMKEALESFLKQAVARGFDDRVLFGTDQMVWPSAISMAVETIRDADYLTAEQKRAILFENAVRFLGIGEEERRKLIVAACAEG